MHVPTDSLCVQVLQKTPTPYSIETRKGTPSRVADLRRVRVSAAATVFVMQPDPTTLVTPRSHEAGRIATPTELNALKTATALHVSAMTGPRQDQALVIQDSSHSSKEIGYMEKFQQCVNVLPPLLAAVKLMRLFRRAMLQTRAAAKHLQLNVDQWATYICKHSQRFVSCRGVAAGSQGHAFRCALQPLGEEVMTSLTAQCACRPGARQLCNDHGAWPHACCAIACITATGGAWHACAADASTAAMHLRLSTCILNTFGWGRPGARRGHALHA